MTIKLLDLLFEFSIEDLKSLKPVNDTAITAIEDEESNYIVLSNEDYEILKSDIEKLKTEKDGIVEDMVLRNIISNNEKKINEFFSEVTSEEIEQVAENLNFNLLKFLFEAKNKKRKSVSRTQAGRVGQTATQIKLKNLLGKGYDVVSSKVGSNREDITIIKNKNIITEIEVKKVQDLSDNILFFDKTVSKKDEISVVFLKLIKKLFIDNELVIVDKKTSKKIDLETIKSTSIILQQATYIKDSVKEQCAEFSKIPEDLLKLIKSGNLSNRIDNEIVGKTYEYFCSHKILSFIHSQNRKYKFFFFLPNKDNNDKVYIQRVIPNSSSIYSRLTVERLESGQIQRLKNMYPTEFSMNYESLLRSKAIEGVHPLGSGTAPRRVGTSGKLVADCFGYIIREDQILGNLTQNQQGIQTETMNLLTNHYNNKADYLVITDGTNFKLVHSPGKTVGNLDSLLRMKGIQVSNFSENNIMNVKLEPSGETMVGNIRIGLKCGIDTSFGFVDL